MNRTTNLWAKKTYKPQNEQMRIEWKRWGKGESCSYGAVMRWAGVMWSGLPLAGPLACYSSYSDDFSAAGELWWPWHMFTVLTTVREQEETLEKMPWQGTLLSSSIILVDVTDPSANGLHSEDCWTGYSKGHTDIPKKLIRDQINHSKVWDQLDF